MEGITAVLSGEQQRFSQKYPVPRARGRALVRHDRDAGQPGSDIVIAHDAVTPLVRAEQASAAAGDRLKHSLDAGQMGTFEVDLDKEEIVFDTQEAKLLGLPGDLHRLSLADFNRMLIDPDATPFEARIAKADGRFADELHLRLPDSSEHWLSFAAAPQRLGKGDCGRYIGLSYDVTERKINEGIFTREVRHRAKNLLAVVLAIARQTAGQKDPEVFADEFSDRIAALSSTIDLLGSSDWRGVDLPELFETHLEPFAGAREQVTLAGPSVMVRPETAQTLGMALHELATNSLKFGALSIPKGRVSIEWTTASDRPDQEFNLVWSETGGPAVKPMTHQGFGYLVLMQQTAWALNGKVEAQYPSSGLIWKLWAPLEEIAADLRRH